MEDLVKFNLPLLDTNGEPEAKVKNHEENVISEQENFEERLGETNFVLDVSLVGFKNRNLLSLVRIKFKRLNVYPSAASSLTAKFLGDPVKEDMPETIALDFRFGKKN